MDVPRLAPHEELDDEPLRAGTSEEGSAPAAIATEGMTAEDQGSDDVMSADSHEADQGSGGGSKVAAAPSAAAAAVAAAAASSAASARRDEAGAGSVGQGHRDAPSKKKKKAGGGGGGSSSRGAAGYNLSPMSAAVAAAETARTAADTAEAEAARARTFSKRGGSATAGVKGTVKKKAALPRPPATASSPGGGARSHAAATAAAAGSEGGPSRPGGGEVEATSAADRGKSGRGFGSRRSGGPAAKDSGAAVAVVGSEGGEEEEDAKKQPLQSSKRGVGSRFPTDAGAALSVNSETGDAADGNDDRGGAAAAAADSAAVTPARVNSGVRDQRVHNSGMSSSDSTGDDELSFSSGGGGAARGSGRWRRHVASSWNNRSAEQAHDHQHRRVDGSHEAGGSGEPGVVTPGSTHYKGGGIWGFPANVVDDEEVSAWGGGGLRPGSRLCGFLLSFVTFFSSIFLRFCNNLFFIFYFLLREVQIRVVFLGVVYDNF